MILKARNVHCVGDLAALSINDLRTLPIRLLPAVGGKAGVLRRALEEYFTTRPANYLRKSNSVTFSHTQCALQLNW
jgi:hypothetical protein